LTQIKKIEVERKVPLFELKNHNT